MNMATFTPTIGLSTVALTKRKNTKGRKATTATLTVSEFSDAEISEWQEADEGTIAGSAAIASPEAVAEKYARSQLRVVRESKDFSLDYLQHALRTPQYVIHVAPDYQRRQRWSNKKRSLLIESFLMNIPIPPVFLFEREYNSYEVVDGRQRLDTVRDFLDNKFSLTGLRYWRELNGQRFNKLPLVIQRGLIRRSIGAVILLAETRRPDEDDMDVRTVLFDRLNTGGEKLNPQELRNALHPGLFNKLLMDLARADAFTTVWGIPKRTKSEESDPPVALVKNTLYRTMADCELVLRFVAIKEALTGGHKGSLRRLLDDAMGRHSADNDAGLEALRSDFIESLTLLTNLFDSAPFRLNATSRPSRPLYDALMVAHSIGKAKRRLRRKGVVQQRLRTALNSEAQYEVLVGRGNTLDAVRRRVAVAERILFEAR